MPADPRRIKDLFAAALDLPDVPARQAFLDRECAGDAELRQRLEALLHAHDQPQPALDEPLVGVAAAEDNQTGPFRGPVAGAAEEHPGAVLGGKYKLMEQIGEGGMGSVWMAQQTEPVKRLVAVKLIKGGDDSKAVLARFEAERQALALMDHPNIARVLDAGTTGAPLSRLGRGVGGEGGGRPFFVMELVKGVPITKFCDARKLTPRQRLELFVPVCQAIQHAHQKGIIHRDIKPSNVLIALYDDRPVPKVIDFGVAKATGQSLTEQTLHTAFGSIVGTLEYMSPEQATLNNLDIDTRSDIYSLGVLLYELLAGSVPVRRKDLEKAGMLEMLRIIREEEPPKPSTKASTADALPSVAANRGMEPAKLTRQLRGEIDWMVMKALEKERSRRYETANGMAQDIQRYLADEPVSAGPPSAAYRLKKFVKRNKGQVVAAVLVLLALVVGVVGLSLGLWAVGREQERTKAALGRAQTAEAEAKANLVQAQSAEGKAKASAHTAALEKEKAQKAEAATLADYQASTDDAIEQLISSKPVLGAQEKTYLQKTLKRWQVFAARTGKDERSRAIRAEGQFRVAYLRAKLSQTKEAAAGFREALTIREKLTDDFPAVPEYRQQLALTHNNLGIVLIAQNRWAKAAEQFHKAVAIQKKLADEFLTVPDYRKDLAQSHNNLGGLLQKQNQGAKAAEQYHMALDILLKLTDEFPAVPEYRQIQAATYINLGLLLLQHQNQWSKAAEQYHKALAIAQKLADEFPAVPEYRKNLALAHNNLGILLVTQKEWAKANEQYHKALSIQQKLADEFPAVALYRKDLAGTHINLGVLLPYQNQWAKAVEQYHKALAIGKKLADEFPTVPDYRQDLASAHNNFGNLLADQKQLEKAAEQFLEALAIRQKLTDEFPGVPNYRNGLARIHNNLGFLLQEQNQVKKAAEQFNKAVFIHQQLAGEFPTVTEYQVDLGCSLLNYGNLLLGSGKPADSLPWCDKAIRTLTSVHEQDRRAANPRRLLRNSHSSRAMTYDQLENYTEAVKDWNQAIELSPPQEQPWLRAHRADSRIRTGRIASAIAEVAELTKAEYWAAGAWYSFACIYAVASSKSADKKQEYADRAIELLHKAVKMGYNDAAHLAKDKDLDVLRQRDDFKKLLAASEAARSKKTMKP